jgi:ubiquinone/menaquinone biosynthesis C-methylase UbiE
MQVSAQVKESYARQYGASSVAWRMAAAKNKARNIQELAKNIAFSNVLEVGCGEGSILHWLSEWNVCENLNGIDISESGVEVAQSKKIKNVQHLGVFDGYSIPFPDQHFDLVICSHVMEHVEHERTLLREIMRVSKYQIFEVPIDFTFYVDRKISHFLSYGHINIYTPALFRFLLKTESFQILNDKCCLYDDELLKMLFASNRMGYYKLKLKHALLRMFPYFLGIKPSSYAVLTQKDKQKATIF